MVLIVGKENETELLAESLSQQGVSPICLHDGAEAVALLDEAEADRRPIDVAFLSSELQNAELEWLISYMRSKKIFQLSRVVVMDKQHKTKRHYWLELGANSCIEPDPEKLRLAASYWATLRTSLAQFYEHAYMSD